MVCSVHAKMGLCLLLSNLAQVSPLDLYPLLVMAPTPAHVEDLFGGRVTSPGTAAFAVSQAWRATSGSEGIISRVLRARGYRRHLTMDGFKVQGVCVCLCVCVCVCVCVCRSQVQPLPHRGDRVNGVTG